MVNDIVFNEEFVGRHAWKFMRADGFVVAPVLKFLKNGIIGGYSHKLERHWSIRLNGIAIQDLSGVTTTSYEITDSDEIGVSELRGISRVDGRTEHVLRRVTSPCLSEQDLELVPDPAVPKMDVIRERGPVRRKNLIVLRANENSLHTQWPRYIEEEDRNWDLCISWYGVALPTDMGLCEYFVHQPKDYKFGAIYRLFSANPSLLDYENFFFPDDDLELSWRDINRLFNIFSRAALSVAQPSLSPVSSSYINHPITTQDPSHLLRYTNFVELMCPMFNREVLEACLPAFENTKTGFGLDHVWAEISGRVPGRMAIIDDVAVVHSRPMALNYNFDKALHELNIVRGLYGAREDFRSIGGIKRENAQI